MPAFELARCHLPTSCGHTNRKKGVYLDWHYAQSEPAEQLSQLHIFSMKKLHEGREIEFRITIHEYAVTPKGHHGRFFAQADQQVNQKTAGFIPSGWGD